MLSLTRTYSAGLLLACVATCAAAAQIDEIFRTEDTNGDNVLSVEEAQAAAPAIFRSIDRDGKGIVTLEDITAYTVSGSGAETTWPAEVLAAVAKNTLELWDANRDGHVTEQGYTQAAVALLLLADQDGDRRVTREELQQFRGEAVTP